MSTSEHKRLITQHTFLPTHTTHIVFLLSSTLDTHISTDHCKRNQQTERKPNGLDNMGFSMSCLRGKRSQNTKATSGTYPVGRGIPRVHDCCYGLIHFPPQILKLMQAPEVQRLRKIGQLGLLPHTSAYWSRRGISLSHPLAFATAGSTSVSSISSTTAGTPVENNLPPNLVGKGVIPSHSRYAHSIGVAYLGQVAAQVFVKQGILTERDVLLITVAGLFHDTGHITFAHAGDHALRDMYPLVADAHEVRSQYLTQHVLRQKRYRDMFSAEEVDLIVHMIHPKHHMPGSTVDYASTRVRRMRNFISNVAHGMDVDQMDYVLFRDPYHLGLTRDPAIMPMWVGCIKKIFGRASFDENDVWRFHPIDHHFCRSLRNQRSYLYKEHYLCPPIVAMDVMFCDILRVLERRPQSSGSSYSSPSFKPASLARWADVRSKDVQTWLPLTDDWFIAQARAVIDDLYLSFSSSRMSPSLGEFDWTLMHQLMHSMWPESTAVSHGPRLYVAHRPQGLLSSSVKGGQQGGTVVDRGCFVEMSCPSSKPLAPTDPSTASSKWGVAITTTTKGWTTRDSTWASSVTRSTSHPEKGSFKRKRDDMMNNNSSASSSSVSSTTSTTLVDRSPLSPSTGTMRIVRLGFPDHPCLGPHCKGQHLFV